MLYALLYWELIVPCVIKFTECLSTLNAVCIALLGADCSLCHSIHGVIKFTDFTLHCSLKPRELLCDLITECCCTILIECLIHFLNASEALVVILVYIMIPTLSAIL